MLVMAKRVSQKYTTGVRAIKASNGKFPASFIAKIKRTLADDSPALMHCTDSAGKIVAVGRRWCELTGLRVQEAMGDGWQKLIHLEDRAPLIESWRQYVADANSGSRKDGFHFEYRILHKNGTWVRMCAHCFEERDKKGVLIGFHGASLEVPESLNVSTMQRSSNADANEESLIFPRNNAPVGKYWSGADGKCVRVNEELEKISGWPAEKILGDGWAQVIHPDDIHWVVRLWNEASTGTKPFVAEYRFVKPDGTVVWILSRVSIQRDRHGNVLNYMGVAVDISELRQKNIGEKKNGHPKMKIASLSKRENDVVRLLRAGLPNK